MSIKKYSSYKEIDTDLEILKLDSKLITETACFIVVTPLQIDTK